jgi:aminocarboxymuconate-semialdehyde decarboxylase
MSEGENPLNKKGGDRLLKIDIHTHILPKEWPDLKQKYGYGDFIRLDHHKHGCAKMMCGDHFFREVKANIWEPEVRMKECDTHQVDVQVLSTVPVMFSYWAKPDHCLELSKILNDHIAGVVDLFPKRFAGLGTIPMQHTDLAIKELERCMTDLKMSGIQIGSNVNNMNLNDPSLFPIFEAAQDLGAAIFVHPWDMMGEADMKRYWLPWLVGMPAETSRAICSMIFGGIFEKLPDLRVAFAHGGGSFPATIGRIEHGYNGRPDLCAIDNPVNPKDYLGKFYLDALVHDPDMLNYIVKLIGKEKVALGTDYPFPLGELEPGKLIEDMPWDRETKAWLLHKSALEWLGLDISRFTV